jgi:hypothetical protein
VLHEIAEPIIERDITLFVQHELDRIRNNYNVSVPKERQLLITWPSQTDIQMLAKMAVPLFIFAATACRFIEDRGREPPHSKLAIILKNGTKSQESKLDATYLPILNQLIVGLSEREKKEQLQQFRIIVGSLIALASPLSALSLARLLNIHPDKINTSLDMLHSVLNVPSSPESPIRLFHLSFRDFLLDQENAKKRILD